MQWINVKEKLPKDNEPVLQIDAMRGMQQRRRP